MDRIAENRRRTGWAGRRLSPWWLAAFIVLAMGTACGGGDDNPAPTGPVAIFNPGDATPASIAQLAGSASGTTFTVQVAVTDVPDFFGAAFRIQIDPDFVVYQGLNSSNSFLRDNGVTNVEFLVDSTTVPGQVIVTATRKQRADGSLPGIDVAGTRELVSLTFRIRTFFNAAADANNNLIPDGSLEFIDPREVCDSAQPVCNPIAVTWSAGAVSGS